ncbi:MAG: hypothetical protein ACI9XO_002205 [Paraglaciecola sp.]|jgi:hypothetical protein
MEVTTNKLGEFEETSSTLEPNVEVSELNDATQEVVNTIQENASFNQRYDYGKENLTLKGFVAGPVFTVASAASKLPHPAVKATAGVALGAYYFYSKEGDFRGDQQKGYFKIEE